MKDEKTRLEDMNLEELKSLATALNHGSDLNKIRHYYDRVVSKIIARVDWTEDSE